ncbi:hypothetical protein F5Y17DRAFT_87271 [Xylariaceae sp. FL0594]|nr:hypothetical protein F5Y17DRAFT_87271 [Xylariaceae sp. FL0594]
MSVVTGTFLLLDPSHCSGAGYLCYAREATCAVGFTVYWQPLLPLPVVPGLVYFSTSLYIQCTSNYLSSRPIFVTITCGRAFVPPTLTRAISSGAFCHWNFFTLLVGGARFPSVFDISLYFAVCRDSTLSFIPTLSVRSSCPSSVHSRPILHHIHSTTLLPAFTGVF